MLFQGFSGHAGTALSQLFHLSVYNEKYIGNLTFISIVHSRCFQGYLLIDREKVIIWESFFFSAAGAPDTARIMKSDTKRDFIVLFIRKTMLKNIK